MIVLGVIGFFFWFFGSGNIKPLDQVKSDILSCVSYTWLFIPDIRKEYEKKAGDTAVSVPAFHLLLGEMEKEGVIESNYADFNLGGKMIKRIQYRRKSR